MNNNKNKRREMREQQNNLCFYCGEILQDDGDNPVTLDHVVPRWVLPPGYFLKDNLVCACRNCNQEKGSEVPVSWQGVGERNRRVGGWQLTDFGNWVWVGKD